MVKSYTRSTFDEDSLAGLPTTLARLDTQDKSAPALVDRALTTVPCEAMTYMRRHNGCVPLIWLDCCRTLRNFAFGLLIV